MKKTILFGFTVLIILFSVSLHSAEGFRFVVMSDTHKTLGNVTPEKVAAAIKKANPEIVLHAGDFTCCLSSKSGMTFKFDELQFLGGIPFFPTTGNHDYDADAMTDYNAFWSSRKPAAKINGEWAHTYSFDHKGWHFVAADFRNPNFSWIKSDLMNNEGKPTVIFSHLAALNVGCKPAYKGELNKIVLADRDIKAVFSGHSHCVGAEEIRLGARQVFAGTLSHDNKRDPKYKGKHTFIVVDVNGENLKICPASVEDGILEGGCATVK